MTPLQRQSSCGQVHPLFIARVVQNCPNTEQDLGSNIWVQLVICWHLKLHLEIIIILFIYLHCGSIQNVLSAFQVLYNLKVCIGAQKLMCHPEVPICPLNYLCCVHSCLFDCSGFGWTNVAGCNSGAGLEQRNSGFSDRWFQNLNLSSGVNIL